MTCGNSSRLHQRRFGLDIRKYSFTQRGGQTLKQVSLIRCPKPVSVKHRGVWIMPLACFNILSALKWPGSWTKWSQRFPLAGTTLVIVASHDLIALWMFASCYLPWIPKNCCACRRLVSNNSCLVVFETQPLFCEVTTDTGHYGEEAVPQTWWSTPGTDQGDLINCLYFFFPFPGF